MSLLGDCVILISISPVITSSSPANRISAPQWGDEISWEGLRSAAGKIIEHCLEDPALLSGGIVITGLLI